MSVICVLIASLAFGAEIPWRSPHRYRLIVRVDPLGIRRSNSPVSVEVDLAAIFRQAGIRGAPDPRSIEVIGHDASGVPTAFDPERDGYEMDLLPWRFDGSYGSTRGTLHFVMPDESVTRYAVYLETTDVGRAPPRRYPGPVGDGDFFRETFQRREIGASHFDAFCDLDGDGDLDLFRGGVEPTIACFENLGGNRFVERGGLASAGEPLVLPHNAANGRSWVLPHFCDLDRDGDQDFFPSFMDGPYARRIVLFENAGHGADPRTFIDRGPLRTVSGTPVAGGEAAGGWFPSVAFVEDFDGDGGGTDLIVGTNDRCYLYRSLGRAESGGWRWADAEALRAGGEEIVLFNPCFAVADLDGDGDRDLVAAPQAGGIFFYENTAGDARARPRFAKGVPLASDLVHTVPSTHPRVTIADFTGDGLLDISIDRAWEATDPRFPAAKRDYGALLANTGTAASPAWTRVDADHGAPHTEGFEICDALRQNVVRAVDWDEDGRTDLIAGDCVGSVWLFRNRTGQRAPIFAPGVRLEAGGAPLSLASSGGHARPDVCDWNADGRKDLIVSDGDGTVTVFLNEGANDAPALAAGRKVEVWTDGVPAPIDRGTRSHILVCDWDGDGRNDLLFSDEENPGFYVFENHGTAAEPRLAPAKALPIAAFVRPNFGSFVDWDGDGKKELIACEFEHSIRLFRDGDPKGVPLVQPPSIMMISGADAIDWNRDGDIDILTGQGHGGSGLRYFERDWIDDEARGTHPRAHIEGLETAGPAFIDVVRRYADAMLEHGRDVYGEEKSGLFLSALDRMALEPLRFRPAPPGGIRREDRAGLPWQRLTGANPQLDQNLLRCLYTLTALTADPRYARAADHEIRWFFENTQSPATGLLPWGEHLAWDAFLDRAISGGAAFNHEFARPWALWERTFALAREPSRRFALGLWEHQIANKKTGGFDRHAPYDRHGPVDGKDFPRHAGFYIDTWAHAYARTKEPVFLDAIETLLARFERKRAAAPAATIGPLDTYEASRLVPDPLATRLRAFAESEDRLILADLPERFVPTWQAGYSSGVAADWAMLALARWEQVRKDAFRDIVVAVADAYRDELPAEDVDVWPMSMAHIIAAQTAAYRLTGREAYIEQACRFARMSVRLFWQDRPIPRASLKTDHYETITGADSLALALLDVHAALNGIEIKIPANTIDR
ncbi:MAG: VCBS repeat-containing protein [Planctomycetes bacterium]|nr:VCBS repeat-containing protein [Planctomycetota bacterium]